MNLTLENLAARFTVPGSNNYCDIVCLQPNCNIVKKEAAKTTFSKFIGFPHFKICTLLLDLADEQSLPPEKKSAHLLLPLHPFTPIVTPLPQFRLEFFVDGP